MPQAPMDVSGPPLGITPILVVSDAKAAIEFYMRAFGAIEIARIAAPDGCRLMHGRLMVGQSLFVLMDEIDELAVAERAGFDDRRPSMRRRSRCIYKSKTLERCGNKPSLPAHPQSCRWICSFGVSFTADSSTRSVTSGRSRKWYSSSSRRRVSAPLRYALANPRRNLKQRGVLIFETDQL
jgi:hypothetical protein